MKKKLKKTNKKKMAKKKNLMMNKDQQHFESSSSHSSQEQQHVESSTWDQLVESCSQHDHGESSTLHIRRSFKDVVCNEHSIPQPVTQQVQGKSATLKYVVLDLGHFSSGCTSFAEDLVISSGCTSFAEDLVNEQGKMFEISIFHFKNAMDANAQFYELKALKNERIIDVHFVQGSDIIMEKIGDNLETWANNYYCTWSRSGSWWHFIKDHFIELFRDVIFGLQYLYSRNPSVSYYCGRLESSVSIVKNRAKLLWVAKAKSSQEFKRETRNDLVALRRMMLRVLLFSLKWNGDEPDVNEQLKTQKVSLPFQRFIENLSATELFRGIHPDWILNDPAFYTPSQKLHFIDSMNDVVRGHGTFDLNKAHFYISSNLEAMGVLNWEVVVPKEKGNRMREVLDYNKESKKGKRNDFINISVYCRNLVVHFNDPLGEEQCESKIEICLKADRLLGSSTCSLLWNVLFKTIWDDPLNRTDRPPFMSKLMAIAE